MLAHSVGLWCVLARCGVFWCVLVGSGAFWRIPVRSGAFWQVLVRSGAFWCVSGTLGRSESVLVRSESVQKRSGSVLDRVPEGENPDVCANVNERLGTPPAPPQTPPNQCSFGAWKHQSFG